MKTMIIFLVAGVLVLVSVISLNIWLTSEMNKVITVSETNQIHTESLVEVAPLKKDSVVKTGRVLPENIQELINQGIIDPNITNPESLVLETKLQQPILSQ